MEWMSTSVGNSNNHGPTVTVMWRDPDINFMAALNMSALNRLIMPIESGMSGYVLEYAWHHEEDDVMFIGSPMKVASYSPRRVTLTVTFQLVP